MAQKYFVVTLIIFSFLPSNLIWSTLGLRETASAFWIMLSFFSFVKIFKNRYNFESLLWGGLLVLSLALSYGARRESALVFAVVLFLLSFYLLLTMKAIVPIVAIIIGLFLGHTFTLTPSPDIDTNSTLPTLAESPLQSINNESPLQSINNESPLQSIDNESPLQSITNQVLTIKNLGYKRNLNRLNAESALPESKCQNVENAQVDVILCNISELPYQLFAFLFRPLPILDSGSFSLTLASIENIFWIAFLSYVIFLCSTSMRYSGSQRALLITLGAYFAIFSSAAALHEGNLGTAFRHKSALLWVCVLVFYISSINRESRIDSA
jgi:hypothetical protein